MVATAQVHWEGQTKTNYAAPNTVWVKSKCYAFLDWKVFNTGAERRKWYQMLVKSRKSYFPSVSIGKKGFEANNPKSSKLTVHTVLPLSLFCAIFRYSFIFHILIFFSQSANRSKNISILPSQKNRTLCYRKADPKSDLFLHRYIYFFVSLKIAKNSLEM